MAYQGHVDVTFPTDISYGSEGGPEFSTEIVELGGGNEQRNQNWENERERWNVAYGVTTVEKMNALLAFFRTMKGRLLSFWFLDPATQSTGGSQDFQWLGVGPGQTFSFIRTNEGLPPDDSAAGEPEYVSPTEGSVHFYIDDGGGPIGIVPIDPEDPPWTINYDAGTVTFDQGSGPGNGDILYARFSYQVMIPMRFDTDYLPRTFEAYRAQSANVPLIEVRLVEDDES